MLAVKGICENGKIELLEPVPKDIHAMVTILFLDTESDDLEEVIEANLLAQSPVFKRLIERGFNEIAQGNTRPARELLNELPD